MTCDPNMIIIDGPWPYVITTMLIAFGFILRGFFTPATPDGKVLREPLREQGDAALRRLLYEAVVARAREQRRTYNKERGRADLPVYVSDAEGRAVIEHTAAINKAAKMYYPDVEVAYRDWLKGEGNIFYIYGFPVLRDANRKFGL